jgi:hypothetical protein
LPDGISVSLSNCSEELTTSPYGGGERLPAAGVIITVTNNGPSLEVYQAEVDVAMYDLSGKYVDQTQSTFWRIRTKGAPRELGQTNGPQTARAFGKAFIPQPEPITCKVLN